MLAHGNGFLYAVYGNVLVKLDADSGAVVHRRLLPEDPNGTGAAYNGMIVLPDEGAGGTRARAALDLLQRQVACRRTSCPRPRR
jgi:hypothetical protein